MYLESDEYYVPGIIYHIRDNENPWGIFCGAPYNSEYYTYLSTWLQGGFEKVTICSGCKEIAPVYIIGRD